MRRLESFPLRARTGQGCPLSALLSNIVLEVLARIIRQKSEIKGIQIRNKQTKKTDSSLFVDNMMFCKGEPKYSINTIM